MSELYKRWEIKWVEPVPDAGTPSQCMVGMWRAIPLESRGRDYFNVNVPIPIGTDGGRAAYLIMEGKRSLFSMLYKQFMAEAEEEVTP